MILDRGLRQVSNFARPPRCGAGRTAMILDRGLRLGVYCGRKVAVDVVRQNSDDPRQGTKTPNILRLSLLIFNAVAEQR